MKNPNVCVSLPLKETIWTSQKKNYKMILVTTKLKTNLFFIIVLNNFNFIGECNGEIARIKQDIEKYR